ncbi:glycosyltransferase family 4 protein [Mangrovimonas sp. ST2L15]|uniref:glycosyltransferase family 4 protein n=1 Tax=Mangrovimonas sp. ST2L15 TaxID=1645916 RepID=UPI0006B67D92|nr:glycosyltransferase family 4 protein [Mangrovimonas sp. ST2L15]
MTKKLAIVTTHPIQYYAPWFRLLAEQPNIEVKVFYTWSQTKEGFIDRTFGEKIVWDIPLLDGYEYEFVDNVSKEPGSHHKNGIICPDLIEKISLWNPDTILVFGWYLKSHFEVMRYFKNKREIWFRGDSNLLDDLNFVKKLLRKIWLTYVYKFVDKVLYVGENNKNYYLEYGLKENQLIFAPHAIDNRRFESSKNLNYDEEAIEWRKELGLFEEDLVVLFVGKFEPKKNPELLISAVQEFNLKAEKEIKLVLIGSGPLESQLKHLASEDENILFLPFQNQSKMPIVYRLGDILCLPSQGPGETWGLVVNEAMASSRGAIVSDKVGSACDLVENGLTGYVFKSNEGISLIQVLNQLTKTNCKEMGLRAHEKIDTYSFNYIVEAIKNSI